MLESLFNKVAGLQDKTHPLQTRLRFHFSLGKTLNVKRYVYRGILRAQSNMYDEAFLQNSEIVDGLQLLTIFTKTLPHRCLTGF